MSQTRMTFSQYAASRGVSQPAVTKAVKAGRISSYQDERGNKYVLKEEADSQWETRTEKERGGKRQPEPVEEPEAPAQNDEPGPEDDFPKRKLGGRPSSDNPNIPPLYQSKAIKEAFFARAAKLKYEIDMAKVVPAEDVRSRWSQVVSITRTKALAIPSKYRQRVPTMTNDEYLILEAIVREALEEMSNGTD